MKGDVEAVKKSLQLWLRSSRFADCLAAVDAEDDVGRATPVPEADAIFTCDKASLPKYPAVELISGPTRYATETAAVVATHLVSVLFSQVGDDEEIVTRDIERLVSAARHLFRGSVLDTAAGIERIEVEAEDYSHLTPQAGAGTFLKGGSLLLVITTAAT